MARYQNQMQHRFAQVPTVSVPRSHFNRSHGLKTTFDAGYLIPIFWDEIYPGDTFNLSASLFGRLATPLHPFMDNLYLDTFYFFVPYRLVWTNFVKFFGEQDNPSDTTSYLVPQTTAPAGGFAELSIFDYFGIPTKVASKKVNTLALRAYNLIFNTWFRDQNLINSVPKNMGDGPDTYTDYALQRRGKRHDYFTSALPWPQKGPSVTVPIGNSAVVKTGSQQFTGAWAFPLQWMDTTGAAPSVNARLYAAGSTGLTQGIGAGDTGGTGFVPNNLFADLSTATAVTINQLRQSFQIQKIYERDARGGTRYTELIQAHFGVTSPDARLQRPEYLGGGSQPINVNPIAQTSATGGTGTPQGNLAAMGTITHQGSGFTQSFTEHGVVLGLCSLRADMSYQQGLERMWTRQTRFDYYWPELQAIGEQSVLNQEIYCDGSANDVLTFGYQERYAEARYKASRVTGRFRSNAAQPLDTWHLSQNFASLPTLSATFIQENPPLSRVIAVTTEPAILLDAWFNLQCARPMPIYSVPGFIDHF